MPHRQPSPPPPRASTFAPLQHGVFRNMWLASLVSNLGTFILGVGAAWDMTQMSGSASMVALVQTATMLPVALFSFACGAIADMFDRRKVAMVALLVSMAGTVALAALSHSGHLTPTLLLVFCFVVGSGTALLWPAWGASVSEQVPPNVFTAAVALNGISFNVARSFGPAIGGLIVAAFGGLAAFTTAAVTLVPLLVVLYFWQRDSEPSRLPPESLRRAMISGFRYVLNAPSIRVVIGRTVVAALAGGAISALLPLVSRDLLGGGAQLFGLLLGSFGIGSIIGALNVPRLRARVSGEVAARICALAMGVATVVVAISHWPVATALALVLFGASWTGCMMILNVTVQMSAPRWVGARTLAAYQAAVSGGVAIGGWGWGVLANGQGVDRALLAAAAVLIVSPVLGRWMRIQSGDHLGAAPSGSLADPNVRLPLTSRSGPIVIEIEYRVDPARARLFYAVMQRVQSSRTRNGAYGWSIARDIGDPELWIERYHCPTWLDYLRQRNRPTQAERELHDRAEEFHIGPDPVRIHRMLERPIGSVRWKDETPDRGGGRGELPTVPGEP